jgi:SAM-dependent methyltransferase
MNIPFAARDISTEQLHAAARSLSDKTVAATVLEKGMQQLQTGGSVWLPRLILVAAQRLGRASEILPIYEGFLGWVDSQSKLDWHKKFSDNAPANDLRAQSGRLNTSDEAFELEYQRIVTRLEPIHGSPVLDIGCAGGLWAISLAKSGYDVIGTDHHAGIIEAARQNAKAAALEGKLEFLVDDAWDSKLPSADYCSRVICISVTPCLPNDAAFESLVLHLDRVSRPNGSSAETRRVILGHNRWGPSRMPAVKEILIAFPDNYVRTVNQLTLMESTWWMHPRHIETIKKRFPRITQIGESTGKLDGVRVDLLLQ